MLFKNVNLKRNDLQPFFGPNIVRVPILEVIFRVLTESRATIKKIAKSKNGPPYSGNISQELT